MFVIITDLMTPIEILRNRLFVGPVEVWRNVSPEMPTSTESVSQILK